MSHKGLFIVVEGADFSGKTTFVKQLKDVLGLEDISSVLFRSPGGDEGGEAIRNLVTTTPFSEEVRALLFSANRVQSTQKIVEPLINRGINVISTRWRWSSDVYQDNQKLSDFSDKLFNVAVPDIYILLETSEEVARSGLNKLNIDHPEYDSDVAEGNPLEKLDLLDEEYTRDYLGVKQKFQEQYDNYSGQKFKFEYNKGAKEIPSEAEFIELTKPLLKAIGYFDQHEILNTAGLVQDVAAKSETTPLDNNPDLQPQPKVSNETQS